MYNIVTASLAPVSSHENEAMSSAEQKRKPGRPKGSFRGHGWSQRRQVAAPIVTAAAPADAEIIEPPELVPPEATRMAPGVSP